MALLEVADLHHSFDGVAALAGASFAVEAGTITGLIGPNGAGKTTLFNRVSGLTAAQRGRVHFNGHDITRWRPQRIARHGLLRTFQISRGFPRLSVLENLLLYGAQHPGEQLAGALLRPLTARHRETELLQKAEAVAKQLALTQVLDQRADAVSGGQKKLLELGRVLMAEPRLILLDEPVAGVNPTLAEALAKHLRELQAAGHTLLIIEHDMSMIAKLCDPVIVLAGGRTLAAGSFAAVAADEAVQQAYMGRQT